MKLTREIKTAVLVLSGIALFIYLFSYLKGEDLFQSKIVYYTEFDYNDLSMSSPVTVKGNKVGKIEAINYNFDTGKTRVEFSVNPKLKFTKTSTVRLYETGLMGGNGLAIINSNTGLQAQPGDMLASEVEPGLISTLQGNFSNISQDLSGTIETADILMKNLNGFLIDDTSNGLKTTIAELNATLISFKKLSGSLQNVVQQNDAKISAMLDNFNTSSAHLNTVTAQLKDVDIKATVENLNNSLASFETILASVSNNKGSLGKLLNDDALYTNFEEASKELKLLLLDIKLHPARYRRILSKKEIPYQKPTEDQLH